MSELTPQEVLAQLQTRGFETGGFRSPLRHFRGKLDSITGSMEQRGQMPQAKLEVHYNFSELEVFASTEPYPFPIAQISMMHSNRMQSNMGVLGASVDKVINAGVDVNAPQTQVKNQDFLIGKVQEWKVTPGHMMYDMDKKQDTPRECWETVYVEGVGGTPHSGVATPTPAVVVPAPAPAPIGLTPAQQALNLLDGKTLQEFNQLVFQDTLIREDTSDLKTTIINNAFIPPMEASGMVTKDDNGVFHVKKD